MRIIIILFIITLVSCGKKDKINHYLPEPITQQELLDNGFYKYSYVDTVPKEDLYKYTYDFTYAYTHTRIDSIVNGDGIHDTIKLLIRRDIYSNVKPEKNEKGQIYPTYLSNFYGTDTIKREASTRYLKDVLKNRIITYLFINDSLEYKSIIVEDFDKKDKEITDFTTKTKIIRYYDSLKISIKPLLVKNISTEDHPTVFLVRNLKTRIRYNNKNPFYEISINYIDNDNYSIDNIIGSYYSGLKWYPVK